MFLVSVMTVATTSENTPPLVPRRPEAINPNSAAIRTIAGNQKKCTANPITPKTSANARMTSCSTWRTESRLATERRSGWTDPFVATGWRPVGAAFRPDRARGLDPFVLALVLLATPARAVDDGAFVDEAAFDDDAAFG